MDLEVIFAYYLSSIENRSLTNGLSYDFSSTDAGIISFGLVWTVKSSFMIEIKLIGNIY